MSKLIIFSIFLFIIYFNFSEAKQESVDRQHCKFSSFTLHISGKDMAS